LTDATARSMVWTETTARGVILREEEGQAVKMKRGGTAAAAAMDQRQETIGIVST